MSYVFKTYFKSKFQQNWTVKNWSNSRKSDKNLKISLSFPYSTYNRNIMCQKCEGICGFWILMKKREISPKYSESMKTIVGAAKSSRFHSNWTGLAVLFRKYVTLKRLSQFFSYFQHIGTYFFNHLIRNSQTTNALSLHIIILLSEV